MDIFQLDVMSAGTELKDAFAQLHEGGCSALVVATSAGDFRLVNFDHMTEALAGGATQLGQVHGQGLPSLEGISRNDQVEALQKMAATIGLISADSKTATLFSVSENLAYQLTRASRATRCDRPDKPDSRTPQSWYHYYPPNSSILARPHKCVFSGCEGTVR